MNDNSNTQLKQNYFDTETLDSVCDDYIDYEETAELEDTPIQVAFKSTFINQNITPNLTIPNVKYAPFVEPIKIDGNLYCIALNWQNESPKGNIQYMGARVADTYKKISNELTTFRVVAKTVKVNYDASKKNLGKAEKYAIEAVLKADGNHKKGPNDYFLIVNGIHGSHTSISRHICHLGNMLISTANHENGHSLGLLHSNVKTTNPKEGSSRDGTSFMSIYSSSNLTVSQSYYMGWRNGMVALYDFPKKVTYRIQKIDAPLKEGNLKAVMLSPLAENEASQKSLFLSWPKFKDGYHLTIHSTYGGKNLGSIREKVFGSQIEYQGFIIEKTAEDDEFITVDVSRTPTPKP